MMAWCPLAPLRLGIPICCGLIERSTPHSAPQCALALHSYLSPVLRHGPPDLHQRHVRPTPNGSRVQLAQLE
jgi:hypothetical protein